MVEDNSGLETSAGAQAPAGEPAPSDDSLIEDVRNLVDDGRTYIETEIQFQKTRAALVVNRGRSGAIYGLIAAALAHLALVALVVGLVITLAPLITALGATALVAGLLVVAAIALGLKAKGRIGSISAAMRETRE